MCACVCVHKIERVLHCARKERVRVPLCESKAACVFPCVCVVREHACSGVCVYVCACVYVSLCVVREHACHVCVWPSQALRRPGKALISFFFV